MKIHVRFHSRFHDVFQGKERDVELEEGATIRDLLGALCINEAQRKSIYARDEERLRHDILITKNRRFIFHMQRLETKLEDSDEVVILYPACMG
jgi:molybdopterin converting factor small subunit